MADAIEIIEKVKKNKSTYKKTEYLLKCYKDMKNGISINNSSRNVLLLLDKALEFIKDDEYIKIITYIYIDGLTHEKAAEKIGMDIRTLYRQKNRLIKRLSIIIYGDEAL